jgi:competence protein ComEC
MAGGGRARVSGAIGTALSWSATFLASLVSAVGAQVAAERDRWVLWLPIALGAGAALYFQLPLVMPMGV